MAGTKVNLWYLGGNTYGGWVTFTAHLYHGLKETGHDVMIRKIGNNTEEKRRPFGYDAEYTNVSELDLPNFRDDVNIITSLKPKMHEHVFDLMLMGASLVMHDPTELKSSDIRDAILATRSPVIVIREKNLGLVPGRTTFLKHPFRMTHGHGMPTGRICAVSISRIDFDKKTELLLDANRLLPEALRIQIRGFENRIYTRFKIVKDYPEWTQSVGHYPREFDAAVNLCRESMFMCDMSAIKGDGGGTQYTFLEAWDAGSIVIINKAWIDGIDADKCVMATGFNCFSVADGKELAERILYWKERESMNDPALDRIRANGRVVCREHDAATIAPFYVEVTRG